jgi:hypothetical protein
MKTKEQLKKYNKGLKILKKYDENPEYLDGNDGSLLYNDEFTSEKFKNISKRDLKKLNKLDWLIFENEGNCVSNTLGDSQGR